MRSCRCAEPASSASGAPCRSSSTPASSSRRPVIDHNKGGLIVDCGIRGFVPISQIVDFPRRPQNEQPRDAAQEIAEKLQPYVGRKLRLKILEVNRKANRLILSEKVALYEERREKRDELFSSLQVGQHVKGTVRSIAPFGVFVDLGGIDGLVHKSELSWNKVNNPEAGYQVGEEVEAEVIDINHERGRISLSIRRLQPDPWHSTVADLKVGDIIEGTVTKIVNFGAFVRVREGLEGLIHISELSHQRVAHPGDVVHEGQTLKLKVISLDSERHRLGLSLKQAEEAPARPTPEPRERAASAPGARRYDPSQAVQEPEGGIDNTLAAAFAQVRQQIAEQERPQPGDRRGDVAEAAPRPPSRRGASPRPPSAEAEVAEAASPTRPSPRPPSAEAAEDARGAGRGGRGRGRRGQPRPRSTLAEAEADGGRAPSRAERRGLSAEDGSATPRRAEAVPRPSRRGRRRRGRGRRESRRPRRSPRRPSPRSVAAEPESPRPSAEASRRRRPSRPRRSPSTETPRPPRPTAEAEAVADAGRRPTPSGRRPTQPSECPRRPARAGGSFASPADGPRSGHASALGGSFMRARSVGHATTGW